MLSNRLRSDERGNALIEFALLAPVIIGLLVGVFQVGISMQSYNAMRGVSSDTARYAMVEYQKKNEIDNAAIETYAEDLAKGSTYVMQNSVDAKVTDATTLQVPGTLEKTLTITYTPPAFLPLMNWVSPQMTFSRPIFLIDE